MNAAEKIERAKTILAAMDGVAVAFSGGVDSALLLKLAAEAQGNKCVAITAVSPIFFRDELRRARELATRFGVRHVEIELDILAEPHVAENPANRCYHCKKIMLAAVRDFAETEGLGCVADGTNADDPGEYRPGLRAAREAGVRHPLLEAGLTKNEIREALREAGVEDWERPSQTCLATRFPTGEKLTEEKLRRVEAAEAVLHRVGFALCRVRYFGATARIELPPDDIPRFVRLDEERNLVERIKDAGFGFVAVDMDGYRSGSMDAHNERGDGDA